MLVNDQHWVPTRLHQINVNRYVKLWFVDMVWSVLYQCLINTFTSWSEDPFSSTASWSQLPWTRQQGNYFLIWKTHSTSTGQLWGNVASPTALLAPTPFSGPNTLIYLVKIYIYQFSIWNNIDKNLHHEIGETVDDGVALGAFYRLRICIDHTKRLHNPLYPGWGLQGVLTIRWYIKLKL